VSFQIGCIVIWVLLFISFERERNARRSSARPGRENLSDTLSQP
jgi:hypothetical protein